MFPMHKARGKTRKQNTYQICPPYLFTFSKHRTMILELLNTKLQTLMDEIAIDENGRWNIAFDQWLNDLKDSIVCKQTRLFPRHKIIVNGIIGTTGSNVPTVCFATHTFMSTDCGDDSVGVSRINPVCFVAVCVAGFAQD
ncbi:unnamed protein product [Trichobilharzia szidati]|nr:unnamed protein product [Trichobilharzia szidati]